MASETVCNDCGSTSGYEWRERCDRCGVILHRGMHDPLKAPGVSNYFVLCDTCAERVRAFLVEQFPTCSACGHLRPEHNTSCLRDGCFCSGWNIGDRVVPKTVGAGELPK